jgi:hypothetical protein
MNYFLKIKVNEIHLCTLSHFHFLNKNLSEVFKHK